MEMASDGFAMGKSVKRGKNSKKMDGKTYAMLGITEEEEMFLNTKAGQPMTAEKRAMQRRYWVAEDAHSHPRYSSHKQLTSLHHNSVKAVEEARHASVARQRTKRLRGTRLE